MIGSTVSVGTHPLADEEGCAAGMNRFYHGLMLISVGSAGLWLGVRALVKTLETGKARLRGGRRITRAHNPGLFRINVVALCTLILLMLCLLYIAATDLI